ncbi:MAG: DUF4386 domain-containing protein [Anaerolineales bacterium]|jgi:hypothetical protein
MKNNRITAIIVGVLFIVGTVAGISSGVVTGPVLGDSDYLAAVVANESSIVLGALLILVMGFPLAMIPVMMFPIFRKYNEPLALGAVVFRGVLEAVTYMVIATCWLSLITISQGFTNAGAADAATFQAMGDFIKQAVYWTEHLLALVFTLGALMLYWLFYKTKLIPNWLALWGFVGAILYFAAPVLNLFDPQHPALSLGVKWGNLMAPLAIQEMVFALWMIIKGFKPSAIVSLSEQ